MGTTLADACVHVGNTLVPSVRIWPETFRLGDVAEHKSYLIMLASALGAAQRGAADRVAAAAMYRGAAVWELYLADHHQTVSGATGERSAAEVSALSCAMFAGDWALVRSILTIMGEAPEGRLREARDTIERDLKEREGAWQSAVTDMVQSILRVPRGCPAPPETNAHIMSVGAAMGAPAQVAWAMLHTGATDPAFVERWRAIAALAEPLHTNLARPILGALPGFLGQLDHYRPTIRNRHMRVAAEPAWMPPVGA